MINVTKLNGILIVIRLNLCLFSREINEPQKLAQTGLDDGNRPEHFEWCGISFVRLISDVS